MINLSVDERINLKFYFSKLGLKEINKSVNQYLHNLQIELDADDYNDRIDYYLEKYYHRQSI